ncbi:MAG: ATP-binding protein [Sandaracinaceae bacterium]
MKLRARLTLSVVAMAIPIVAGVAGLGFMQLRRGLVDATYEATVERMMEGGLTRCERAPGRFERRVRRRARGGPFARVVGVYDERFVPSAGHPLDPDLRRELEGGSETAVRWLDAPARARIAMRMPWDGPCAVLLVERPSGPEARAVFLRIVVLASIAALLTALAAFAAIGPLVRRIRQLEGAVRAQATAGYEKDVTVQGSDEIAELARAFNEASAEIRARLEELSARDRALTQYLMSTTHDVMVPLTVLMGHLSELRRSEREGRADPSLVSGALEEAHYLAALIRNLAAAARLEAGEPMLTRHDFDLAELVERAVSRHRPIAEERGIALDFAVPEEPTPIHADSTLVEQALGNLIHNALVYNREGGHVAVVLERRGDRFVARVSDDGPGLPEGELARVTERTFRGGEARSRRPTGLGLGLHIVRDVAERHAFQLRFESPDEGGLQVELEGPIAIAGRAG